jgi:hypothetical protein
MHKEKTTSKARKRIKFQLNRDTVRELGIEELAAVVGADATASCCVGCNTLDGTFCPATCS